MNLDQELDVMQAVVTALEPLTPAAQQRVLNGVANGLGLRSERAGEGVPGGEGDEADEQAREDVHRTAPG